MDIGLYVRVLWRFRVLVAAGLIFAALLATMAYGRISPGGDGPLLTPRGEELWQSSSVLLISQKGFPWGRAVPEYTDPDPEAGVPPVQLGDQGRFSGLSQVYSQLANSDAVRAAVLRKTGIAGAVQAEPSSDPASGAALPLMTINASATTPDAATQLAQRATGVFLAYVERQQDGANIPADQRITLEVLESGRTPELVMPRKKTLPVLVFLAVAMATVALAFVLENLRPLMPRVAHPGPADPFGAQAHADDYKDEPLTLRAPVETGERLAVVGPESRHSSS